MLRQHLARVLSQERRAAAYGSGVADSFTGSPSARTGPSAVCSTAGTMSRARVFGCSSFTIPYRIEGTVWLDVGSLGRVAIGLGPAEGSWTIPASALMPGS